jgi:hypothetical protein
VTEASTTDTKRATDALNYIIPILEKYHFQWLIPGGFASLVHGVSRSLTDIDIDIDTSIEAPDFKRFLKDIAPFTTEPLHHFVDQNYDNWNVEAQYKGQLLDICPIAELKIFDQSIGQYRHFYANGLPEPEIVSFHGLELPLLPKSLIIQNKEMLVW